jgi:hypothetical protein
MAKQAGIIKLNGRIGDLAFYEGKDGFSVKQAKGFSAERVRTDPKLQRTRENIAEFRRGVKASKVLRTALRSLLVTGADRYVATRLTQALMRVIQADVVNDRGSRTVVGGDLSSLSGFEFNQKSPLTQSFITPFTSSIDRVSGQAFITVESFNARNAIVAPKGATHFKLVSAMAAVNFESETSSIVVAESPNTPIDAVLADPIEFAHQLGAGSTDSLMLVLGIEFSQVIGNGQTYPLHNGSFNALSLVAIDNAV